eukprot:TRINITY_DN1027_c0_g1_i1.p1 TRINITY_DN1027_c0_g1~~TRINITY_DN1027_c0_g1_i1.p1  ORF type:complete len:204 (+),score=32.82 TRINITY_DN1027_c0_g1_i1:72-683(+)
MKSSVLKPHIYLPRQPTFTTQPPNAPNLPSINTNSFPKHPSKPPPTLTLAKAPTYNPKIGTRYPTKPITKHPILETTPTIKTHPKQDFLLVSPNGFSKLVVLGAVSVGVVLFLVGVDGQKALALGPEGPLMEEFWDNMRRYGLYIVTVSTGVIYTIFQPILELLKNPITAILIITILGGSLYLVSQVLALMFGISEFAYDYGY